LNVVDPVLATFTMRDVSLTDACREETTHLTVRDLCTPALK